MKTKRLPAVSVKADDDGQGIITALVATWDVDSDGDQIERGAFAKSLKAWDDRAENIPFIWSHQHNDPFAHIGEVTSAEETDEGLLIKAQVDMDEPLARKVYKLVKGGRVRQYSFGYAVKSAAPDGEVNRLTELDVFEVGPTLVGVNQQTRTVGTKGTKGETLGNLLRRLRDDAELSNEDLADAAGIDASSIGQILSGDINCPPVERLEGVATALDVPAADLIEAAEADGCDYSNGESSASKSRVVRRKGRNVGQWMESRIHENFTMIADQLFGDGRLTRAERIALSGGIGDALTAFVTRLEGDAPQLYGRDLYEDPADLEKALTALQHKARTQWALPGNEAHPAVPVKADEPPKSGVKADEPNQTGPAEALAMHHELLSELRST